MPSDAARNLTTDVSPRLLRRLAGDRYFDRGEAYFAEGAVRSLRGDGDGVKAVVQGTRRYRVRLWARNGDVEHDCTCPLGRDGEFCKHCVAVGLAWRAAGQSDDAGGSKDTEIDFALGDLRAYLQGLDNEELVSLLVDQADEDERLHRRLTLRAAQAGPGAANLSVWKEALDEALGAGDYVDYRDAYDHVAGVEEVIESLEDLLRAGSADNVIQLADYGLAEVEQSLEYIDDSDGWMGGLLARLQELHLEACRRARPDPVDLAERLFEGEMESSFDTFRGAVNVYADVLGEAGLSAYRRLAEAEWAKVPALKPGEDDPNRYGARYQITSIMETMARASEDFDALVAVKSRDLSSPYAFLEIAKLHQDSADPDRALDWAERGWRAFSGSQRDERLRDFLADAYQGRGRHEEAMKLVWEAFVKYPGLETYRRLERHGCRARQWPDWRDKALVLVRQRIDNEGAEPPDGPMWARDPSRDHSLLVDIFLHEGDSDAAWREAETGGCSKRLWLELAKRREKSHPEDSVRIYEAHVDALLRDTGERVYEEAVGMLEKIRKLLVRSGREDAFRPLLITLRATHKRKRNLMKKFDLKGW